MIATIAAVLGLEAKKPLIVIGLVLLAIVTGGAAVLFFQNRAYNRGRAASEAAAARKDIEDGRKAIRAEADAVNPRSDRARKLREKYFRD